MWNWWRRRYGQRFGLYGKWGMRNRGFSVCAEGRRDDGETGLRGSGVSSTNSSSLDIWTPISWDSSSSNNAEAGRHSVIAVSIAGEGDRGGGVLEFEAYVGGRSVGTSKLDGFMVYVYHLLLWSR